MPAINEILIFENAPSEIALVKESLGPNWLVHSNPSLNNLEEFFLKTFPDLIICDMDTLGCQALEIIERLQILSESPIVVKSRKLDREDKLKLYQLGIAHCVAAPFIREELASVFTPYLMRSQSHQKHQWKNNVAFQSLLALRNHNHSNYKSLNNLLDLLTAQIAQALNHLSAAQELEDIPAAEDASAVINQCLVEIQILFQNNRRQDRGVSKLLKTLREDLQLVGADHLDDSAQQKNVEVSKITF